jgi:CheY-like chemotaxis protein
MPRLLIVEDERGTRECLAALLRKRGYVATTAANGRDAWVTLYAGLPDLILLDLMMPQMDGLTFLRMLREHHHWNSIPVVIFTGHADEEKLLQQAQALGVSRIIPKDSSDGHELLRSIAQLASPGVSHGARQARTRNQQETAPSLGCATR